MYVIKNKTKQYLNQDESGYYWQNVPKIFPNKESVEWVAHCLKDDPASYEILPITLP